MKVVSNNFIVSVLVFRGSYNIQYEKGVSSIINT